MWEDPIVAEVHRARAQLAAEYNYDMAAYFAAVQKRQELLGSRLVRLKPPADDSDSAHSPLATVGTAQPTT